VTDDESNSGTLNISLFVIDTTAPTVTFNPSNGNTGYAISDNITIAFNEAVRNTDNSALTNSNVDSLITLKLTNASGNDVSFDATIDSDKKVITIDPTSNLANSQAIYVAIGATVEDELDFVIKTQNNISAKFTKACAVRSDGNLFCWTGSGNNPTQITGISGAVSSSNGAGHSCVIISGGSVKCWGDNTYGELGSGTTSLTENTPVNVTNLTTATMLSLGYDHSCALLSDKTVKCWGRNNRGQIGNGGSTDVSSPASVTSVSNVVSITSGLFHTCALISGGTVKCWGYNLYGQTGNITGLSNVSSIGAGQYNSCAVISGGIKCWGRGEAGALGNGSQSNSASPVSVADISNASKIQGGDGNFCAVLTDGTIKCWGNGSYGVLGNGTTTTIQLTPVSVSNITSATDIVRGAQFACALLSNKKIMCWGSEGGGVSNSVKIIPEYVSGFGG